jgi:acyl-ACP thioesterase
VEPFTWATQAGLGDVAVSGRVRLDTLLRWLQDAAHAHVVDLGFAGEVWVVRRTTLQVKRWPVHDEPVIVRTWPSGLARLWAQRETTIAGDAGVCVRATAIWVHLDEAGRPRPLSEAYVAALAVPDGPRVRARLTHPVPPAGAVARPWTFRVADLDMADHVNNAAYWEVLEEELRDWPADRPLEAEVEHPAAAGAGPASVVSEGSMRWVIDAHGVVVASLRTAIT